MESPEPISRQSLTSGRKCTESWGDDCIGNGITIRNLQKALEDAERLINTLRGHANAPESSEQGHLGSIVCALEKKLLHEQSRATSIEKEVILLRSHVSQFETANRKIAERVIRMIKDDSWLLPSGANSIELPREESSAPTDYADYALKMLDALEAVRNDVLEVKKKEMEQKAQSELVQSQKDVAITQKLLAQQEARNGELNTVIRQIRESERQKDIELMALTQQVNEAKAMANLAKDREISETEVSRVLVADLQTTNKALEGQIAQLRQTLEEKTKELEDSQAQLASVRTRATHATNTDDVGNHTDETLILSKPVALQTIVERRSSLKRPLSPVFGISQLSNIATTDEEMQTAQSQEEISHTSPTPHLDELFAGPSESTTKRSTTVRGARTRRKVEDASGASQKSNSAPSTPVVEPRRPKRTKVMKTNN